MTVLLKNETRINGARYYSVEVPLLETAAIRAQAIATFGPAGSILCFNGDLPRWASLYNEFWFRSEKDLSLFLLML